MNKLLNYDIDKLYVCSNINYETKDILMKEGRVRKINKNKVIFHEKEAINKVYFLLEGKISIFKINENGERKIIFILKQGEMINELLLDDTKTSTVGCEAFEESLILEYDVVDFIKVMEKDFILTKNILMYMERRTRRLYRQLKNSISINMNKKLAAKLYRISKEFGVKQGEWSLINVNLTITYIAEMLGCKRETLSRSMKVLQEENLVKLDGKKFYVKEIELSKYFKG